LNIEVEKNVVIGKLLFYCLHQLEKNVQMKYSKQSPNCLAQKAAGFLIPDAYAAYFGSVQSLGVRKM
jgi:hypothetical protein